MTKCQKTLVKFQNGKPNPRKTQIVVSCVKNGSVEKTEKVQNKEMIRGLSITANLTEQNRIFLEERCNEGTINDLVSLIKAAWDNYHVAQFITLVEQSQHECSESLEGTT